MSRFRQTAPAREQVAVSAPTRSNRTMLQTARMRSRLERSYRFEAAHYLPRVPAGHKCARMHGHSYEIQLAIEGELDRDLGWVMDFASIDEYATPLVKLLDHQILNEIEGLDNPTIELVAAWWWHRLKPILPQLVEVSAAETVSSRCIFRG